MACLWTALQREPQHVGTAEFAQKTTLGLCNVIKLET